MTDAQILVNNRLHIQRNSGTKQAYQGRLLHINDGANAPWKK